jgi:hypothetical protein
MMTMVTTMMITYTHHQTSLADRIKENEVGGACGTHGRGKKLVQGFGGKAPTEEDHPKTKE